MTVTIYTSPTCQYCKLAKQFLKQRRVRFSERSVADVKIAQEMVDRTRQTAVPAFVIEDQGVERVMIGFREEELKTVFGVR